MRRRIGLLSADVILLVVGAIVLIGLRFGALPPTIAGSVEPAEAADYGRLAEAPPVVFGTVLDLDGKTPLSGAAVTVESIHGVRIRELGRGETAKDGVYQVSVPRLQGKRRLVVRCPGRATFVRDLVDAPNGDSVLVGPIVLRRGAKLAIPLVWPKDAATEIVADAFEDRGLSTLDVDQTALGHAALVGSTVVLEDLPPGPLLVVLRDRTTNNLAARVLPFIMSSFDVELPEERLEIGRVAVTSIGKTSLNQAPSAEAVLPTGSWPLDGGPEFRLMMRPQPVKADDGVVYAAGASVQGIVSFEFRTGDAFAFVEVVAGQAPKRFALTTGAVVRGMVVNEASNSPIPGAAVIVDGYSRPTNARGEFSVPCVRPGGARAEVHAAGFCSANSELIVVPTDGDPPQVTIKLRPKVDVEVACRDSDAKPLVGAVIGMSGNGDDAATIGVCVLGVSDDRGIARGRVAAGPRRIQAHDRRGISDPIAADLRDLGPNRLELGLEHGGAVSGVVADELGKGIPGATVVLGEGPNPLDLLLGPALVPRDLSPRLYMGTTDVGGRYELPPVVPGRYQLVIFAEDRPPFVAGAVDVASGSNPNGFQWRVDSVGPSLFSVDAETVLRLDAVGGHARALMLSGGKKGTAFDLRGHVPGLRHVRAPYPARSALSEEDGTVEPTAIVDIGPWPSTAKAARAFFGPVTGKVRINGGPVDGIGAELIAYPVETRSGLLPRRIAMDDGTGEFDGLLEEGSWRLVGRSPGFGDTAIGPVLVQSLDRTGAVLDDAARRSHVLSIVEPRTARFKVKLGERLQEREEEAAFAAPVWLPAILRWTEGPRAFATDEASGSVEIPAGAGGKVFVQSRGSRGSLVYRSERDVAGEVVVLGRRRDPAAAAPWRFVDLRALGDPFDDLLPRGYDFASTRGAGLESALDRGALVACAGVATFGFDGAVGRQIAALRSEATPDPESPPGARSLHGSIAVDGKRRSDAMLTVIPVDGTMFRTGARWSRTTTDDKGEFEVERVVSEALFVIETTGDDGRIYRWSRRAKGGELPKSLELASLTHALRIAVVDAVTDARQIGARVTLLRSGGRGHWRESVLAREIGRTVTARSGADGTVVFSNVPEGTYDVLIEAAGRGEALIRDVEVKATADAAPLVMRAASRAAIALHLSDPDGAPVREAKVFAETLDGTEVGILRTFVVDEAGFGRIDGIAPGAYAVFARLPSGEVLACGTVTTTVGATAFLEAIAPRHNWVKVQAVDERGAPLAARFSVPKSNRLVMVDAGDGFGYEVQAAALHRGVPGFPVPVGGTLTVTASVPTKSEEWSSASVVLDGREALVNVTIPGVR